MTPTEFLEKIYEDCQNEEQFKELLLTDEIKKALNIIVKNEENMKGVFTCIVSSLTYKVLHPEQDVRYHKVELPGGYSGRSFDTKYVTPFLKKYKFAGAMKEAAWLTRSIEQAAPFDRNFPGKIQKAEVKTAFLDVFEYTYLNNKAYECLFYLLHLSIIENKKRHIQIINPIDSESELTINEIMDKLSKHFYFEYKSRGASILPVIALYSIYECIISELKRFNGMYLDKLGSHNSCDRSSGATGDIVVRRKIDNSIYEVVEVKFDIPIDRIIVNDAYRKISEKNIQRYYILSTVPPQTTDIEGINEEVFNIHHEHGCQFIINGVFQTLKYYLRLLSNTDDFVNRYVYNLQNNEELNLEHKKSWNIINK